MSDQVVATTGSAAGLSQVSNGTLLRQLLVLALPVLAEHALHVVVGITDTFLANRVDGQRAEATAAVGTVAYIFWFLGLFSAAIGTGATAIIARAIGARHRSRANSACGQAILFALVVGLGLGAFVYFAAESIVAFASLQGAARDLALSYFRIISPAVPFLIVMFVANACLRGAGDTLRPAIAMIVVDVVNVICSCTLVWGWFGFPKMGFTGIALGTLIAYITGGILVLAILLLGWGKIQLHPHRLRPHWHDMKRITKIGAPNVMENLINWSANFFLVKIVNQTAPINVAAAAHTNSIRIESISYMTGFAVAVATATMVGQSLGARDPQRAGRCAYLAFAVGGGFMTLVGLFFIFFSKYPAMVLSGDSAVAELTARCLMITGFCQAGFAAAIIFGGALRGAGDTFAVMLLSLVTVLLLRFGAVAVVGGYFRQPLDIIWIVLSIDLFLRGALVYGRFLHGGWKKIQV